MEPEPTAPRYDFEEDALRDARVGADPRPRILELHPSPVCQLRCDYCHSMAPPREATIYSSPATTLLRIAEYDALLADFESIGGEVVVVSGGGEPLLFKNIVALLRVIRRRQFRAHLYTNGLSPLLRDTEAISDIARLTSVRFSLHASMRPQQRDATLASIRNLAAARRSLGTSVKVHAAVLVDTYERTNLEGLLKDFPPGAVDEVELRHTLGSAAPAEVVEALVAMLKQSAQETSIRTASADIPAVPASCAVLYRSVTIDPYGGVRTCCMRAHLPATDFSLVGNIRRQSLREVLASGRSAMAKGGVGACDSCAQRDSEFSTLALSSKAGR